jgi:hypothetical protein
MRFGLRSCIALACFATAAAAGELLVPVIDGDWWQVAGNPDLGELTSEKQEPVDFGVWQAADGTWQLWSCIRHTRERGKTRLFFRWEGKRITAPDWQPMGIAMRGTGELGEVVGGLQAPHVVTIDGVYHMFYGNWKDICLATSKDGKTFTRKLFGGLTGLFTEGTHAQTRDPMLLRYDGRWYCYFAAHPKKVGGIWCRTSKNLTDWSERRLVARGGQAGRKWWNYECPHVVRIGGFFYLFHTQRYRNPQSSVYRSPNPFNFGIDDDRYFITHLPVAAPEIVLHEGQYYIAGLNPDLDGIRLAKLKWVPHEPAKEGARQ